MLACCGQWRTQMGAGPRRRRCSRAPNAGGRGAPMLLCTCGPRALPHPKSFRTRLMRAKLPESFSVGRLDTPIGPALAVTDAEGVLRAFDWEDHAERIRELMRLQYGAVELKADGAPPRVIRSALSHYFQGDL